MRYFIVVVSSILLMACAATPGPESSSAQAWKDFGQQQALKGSILQSENRLMKSDTKGELNNELYKAYQEGYRVGKEEYCNQNAYKMGVMGEPYLGICYDIKPFFQQDYDNGRNSGTGRL
ncbi:DUF2799 domain-containing protein [Vibrio mexicanus]|uniref:DUF2799 domain-containing protein n=1 Tax=Vibrio mexicanus TaxID=1004326 RepID=UPI00063CA99F|nr:DUF2799 domain-containing protein [Vibrio mexicanus]